MPVTLEHDVFLSHSNSDKPAVRELADRLNTDGDRAWSDGGIRWMEVSSHLAGETERTGAPPKQIVFKGEPFTAFNLRRIRDRFCKP